MFEYIEDDDILILRRKDLYPITNFKTKDITMPMFVDKYREDFLRKSLVIFIDDDLKYTILKNRFGHQELLDKKIEELIGKIILKRRRKIIKKIIKS
tara:strand:- start:8512 stop:8802 length:291 start_codon:yes stop_codon:yes gene_type:complete